MQYIQKYTAMMTLIGSISLTPATYGADEYNLSKGTTVDGQGIAFRANDVVAYVTGLGIVPGEARHTYVDDNVAYYFKSTEALKLFAANPEEYKPQYGGFCAFGVAVSKKLDGSPRYADIVDGKLYLFLNAEVMRMYKEDKENILAKAKINWPAIQHLSVAEANGT